MYFNKNNESKDTKNKQKTINNENPVIRNSIVYNKLINVFPDFESFYSAGKVNILPLPPNEKLLKESWKQYQSKPVPLDKLKKHNGNFGILLGYQKENRDYWLAGIDIDGLSLSHKEIDKSNQFSPEEKSKLKNLDHKTTQNYKHQTRKDLYNLLKGLKDVIVVQTANRGYHFYYWTKKDTTDKFIDNIYYPEDYSIEMLQNKPVTYSNKHIEHFTSGRQFVFPPSKVNRLKYKFFSRKTEIKSFFKNPRPKNDIESEIKELVKKNNRGYRYKEALSIEKSNTITNNKFKTNKKENISISSGLVKHKIQDTDTKNELLENIKKAGYYHGNMNNLGYILICNFRRHGLNKNEVFNIFKEIPIKDHDLSKVKSWINDKYRLNLDDRDYSKFAGLNALMKEIESSARPIEADELKRWFANFFSDIIQIFKDKPENRNDLMKLAEFLKNEYNIVKTLENPKKPVYYYFDTKLSTYKEITEHELGAMVYKDYNLTLPAIKYKTILESCHTIKKVETDYIEMKDHYINIQTLKVLEKKDNDILTSKKLYNKHHDRFYEYDPSVKTINKNNATFTEQTLKKILIPIDNPKNIDYYTDYFQRKGASIGLNNKVITAYLGGGYNGKSVLNWLGYVVFNGLYSGISPEEFKKDFNYKAFENKHMITIDELDYNSFKGMIPHIKRFRGGGVPLSSRTMYEPDYTTSTDYGMLWLFSNELPNIPLNEKALFQSMDIITLPNKFVEKEHLKSNKNTYLEDRQIKDKLLQDFKGLNWAINAALIEAQQMKKAKKWFKCRQTADETIAIITQNDYLLNFLALYTEYDTASETTNKEIKEQYQSWIKKNNYKITLPTEHQLSIDIGTKIKELYNKQAKEDKLKGNKTDNKATYKLRLKSFKEVNTCIYEINEDLIEQNPYTLEHLGPEQKTIYNAIKKGFNTFKSLEHEYPDKNIIQILTQLEDSCHISRQEQTALNTH